MPDGFFSFLCFGPHYFGSGRCPYGKTRNEIIYTKETNYIYIYIVFFLAKVFGSRNFKIAKLPEIISNYFFLDSFISSFF